MKTMLRLSLVSSLLLAAFTTFAADKKMNLVPKQPTTSA